MKTFAIGRLGDNAKEMTAKNGSKFVTMSVAVDEFIAGKNETIWLSVVAEPSRLGNMFDHLTKGKLVQIVGNLNCQTFNRKDGTVGIDYRFSLDSIAFVPGGKKEDGTEQGAVVTREAQAAEMTTTVAKPKATPAPATSASSSSEAEDEELPF